MAQIEMIQAGVQMEAWRELSRLARPLIAKITRRASSLQLPGPSDALAPSGPAIRDTAERRIGQLGA